MSLNIALSDLTHLTAVISFLFVRTDLIPCLCVLRLNSYLLYETYILTRRKLEASSSVCVYELRE